MESRRWLNPHQPQTLQIAVFLLYADAFFGLLSLGAGVYVVGLLLVAGHVAAGYGIANEQKWGYALGIAMAISPFFLRLAFGGSPIGPSIINLMFEVALVALLLHPQSREYQRVWFK